MFFIFLKKIRDFFYKLDQNKIKIESVKYDEFYDLNKISIRFYGKCSYDFLVDPIDLLIDSNKDRILSEDDFKTVLGILIENEKNKIIKKFKVKFKIVNHLFSKELDEPVIVYRDIEKDMLHTVLLKDLYIDVNMISKFDSNDVLLIGFIFGTFQTKKDIFFIRNIKK